MAESTITLAELLKAHVLDVHLPNILVGVTASIEVPLVTSVGRFLKLDHSQIANFVLLSAICRTALDIPFGIAVEFVGVRNTMLGSLALNAAAALMGAHIGGLVTFGVYCALSGISLGGFFLSRHIFVAGVSSKRYRGLLMSFLSGMLRWSHALGPLITGLVASQTGDTRNAFYIAAVSCSFAFLSIVVALYCPTTRQQCEHSCTTSCRSSVAVTPTPTDNDEHEGGGGFTMRASSGAGKGVAGDEDRPLVPPLAPLHSDPRFLHDPCDDHGCQVGAKVHPSLGPYEEHFFHPSALWYTVVDYWPVIWRFGVYVVALGALRSNRKLLLVFSAMEANMSDAQLSYLLSFSFAFDAMLFLLGGIIMDFVGRQLAMAPVAICLGLSFLLLTICHSPTELYVAAASFGIADAMGCGLVMTLTADRAPKLYGAPFFGIVRTLADLGHVVGAGGASFLIKRFGHRWTCLILAGMGLPTALWGVFCVPKDTEPMETPRLQEAATKGRRKHGGGGGSALYRSEREEQPLLFPGGPQQRRTNNPTQPYGAA